jgi:hypothetical protein
MLFCDKNNILYSTGKVALNGFPKEFFKVIDQRSSIFDEI